MLHFVDRAGRDNTLGVIAEQTTATMRRASSDFVEAGVRLDETPYLGPVTRLQDQLVQWVKVEHLLTDAVRERLFTLTAAQ